VTITPAGSAGQMMSRTRQRRSWFRDKSTAVCCRKETSMKRHLKTAPIGTGFVGRLHLENLLRSGCVKVAALVTTPVDLIRTGMLAAQFGIERVETDYRSVQVDAPIRKRRPRTKLNRTQQPWFRSSHTSASVSQLFDPHTTLLLRNPVGSRGPDTNPSAQRSQRNRKQSPPERRHGVPHPAARARKRTPPGIASGTLRR
jgi:hypothetical protein